MNGMHVFKQDDTDLIDDGHEAAVRELVGTNVTSTDPANAEEGGYTVEIDLVDLPGEDFGDLVHYFMFEDMGFLYQFALVMWPLIGLVLIGFGIAKLISWNVSNTSPRK